MRALAAVEKTQGRISAPRTKLRSVWLNQVWFSASARAKPTVRWGTVEETVKMAVFRTLFHISPSPRARRYCPVPAKRHRPSATSWKLITTTDARGYRAVSAR